jgi:adenosylmethionine-8-amino-7-oxononanoate aminotransferase
MTGFGRTGTMFASEQLEHYPDIICLSKGLTGGFMPLGISICSGFIFDAFISDDKMKTFFHGHSYTANPLACSAANASLDLFEREGTLLKIKEIERANFTFYNKVKHHSSLLDVRFLGTILAFELKTNDVSGYLNYVSEEICSFFIDRGVLLRPLGNIFYLIPPYCITNVELSYIYSIVEEFLDTQCSEQGNK